MTTLHISISFHTTHTCTPRPSLKVPSVEMEWLEKEKSAIVDLSRYVSCYTMGAMHNLPAVFFLGGGKSISAVHAVIPALHKWSRTVCSHTKTR